MAYMVTTIHYRLQEQSQIVNSTNIKTINFKFLRNTATFGQAMLLFIGMH